MAGTLDIFDAKEADAEGSSLRSAVGGSLILLGTELIERFAWTNQRMNHQQLFTQISRLPSAELGLYELNILCYDVACANIATMD